MSEIKALDRLRESSHLDDNKWTLETGEVVHIFCSEPNDPNAVNWGEQWRKIADEIEREIAERYMELPVDKDGVPVRIGDKMTNINKPSDEYTVTSITESGCRVYGDCAFIKTSQLRHVKPRTVEDVLRDCCNEWNEHCGDDWESGVYAKYANELRELLIGGDAE